MFAWGECCLVLMRHVAAWLSTFKIYFCVTIAELRDISILRDLHVPFKKTMPINVFVYRLLLLLLISVFVESRGQRGRRKDSCGIKFLKCAVRCTKFSHVLAVNCSLNVYNATAPSISDANERFNRALFLRNIQVRVLLVESQCKTNLELMTNGKNVK